MSLESRMESFGRLCDRFPCDKPSWCVADYKIPDEQFKNLQSAIAIYMSKGLPNQKLFTDDESIMSEYAKVRAIDRSLIKNCNPNGMLVPKKENSLEYNAVVKAYMEIMNTMNVRDLIPSYHVPLADFANLHASTRNPGCRARVSIDTTFALMRSEEEMARAAALEATGRTKERLSYDTLSQIGISKAFYFPQSIHDPISATPLHKHSAILRLVDLENGTDLEDAEKLL